MEQELQSKESKRLAGGRTDTNPENLKALYKVYYRESWKTARIILTIVGIALLVVGITAYLKHLPLVYAFVPVWIGAVMVIYPRNAYKKPYKEAKNEKSSIFFAFYDKGMTEKTDGSLQHFDYDTMHEVIETPKYFFFFHSRREVSILEKSGINRGTADGLASILEMRVKKYRIVK